MDQRKFYTASNTSYGELGMPKVTVFFELLRQSGFIKLYKAEAKLEQVFPVKEETLNVTEEEKKEKDEQEVKKEESGEKKEDDETKKESDDTKKEGTEEKEGEKKDEKTDEKKEEKKKPKKPKSKTHTLPLIAREETSVRGFRAMTPAERSSRVKLLRQLDKEDEERARKESLKNSHEEMIYTTRDFLENEAT